MRSKIWVTFLVMLAGFQSFSQITIIGSDMIQVSDVVSRNADTMTVLSPGPAGPNQSWNMVTATPHVTETTTAMSPSATTYSSSFASSNLALTNDNVNYVYMYQDNSTAIAKGAAGDLLNNGSVIVTSFNPDLLLDNFPRTYGSNFSDTYGIDVTTSGSSFGVYQVRYKQTGIVYDTTDGWGTITTPVGTYNSLRVKRISYTTDTIWYKLIVISPWAVLSTKKDTSFNYTWLAKETKLAVAELSYDTLDQPKKFTWSLIPPDNTSLVENFNENGAAAFPSPASEYVTIRFGQTFSKEVTLSVFNDCGGLVRREKVQPSGFHTVSVHDLPPGIYSWLIQGDPGKTPLRGNFLISR